MPGVGHVSAECFTSLNFVCFRSQYVGAVNSKLSAELRRFGVARFCDRGFNDLPLPPTPPVLSTYRREIRRPPSPFRLTEVRGKALPDINFVNNELPASTRETLRPPAPLPPFVVSFLSRHPLFFLLRAGDLSLRLTRERISRTASRGNFSPDAGETGGTALAKQLRDSSLFPSDIVRGPGERKAEL